MCNFKPHAGPFFIFIALNCLSILQAITMGLFIGSLSPNLQLVQAVAPAMNVLFIIFGGFLLPLPSIPDWFIWIYWGSYVRYIFAGLTINEFKGLQFSCPPGKESQCFATGQAFLDRYDLETVSSLFLLQSLLSWGLLAFVQRPGRWLRLTTNLQFHQFTIAENAGLLGAIIVIFAILGYFKLRHLTRPNLRLN